MSEKPDCKCENEVDANGITWFGFKIDPWCPLHGTKMAGTVEVNMPPMCEPGGEWEEEVTAR